MPCPRCRGLMVRSAYYGNWESMPTMLKCVNCGNVVDQLILRHQRERLALLGTFDRRARIWNRIRRLARAI